MSAQCGNKVQWPILYHQLESIHLPERVARVVLDVLDGMQCADPAVVEPHRVVVLHSSGRAAHVVLHGVQGAEACDGAADGILDLDAGLDMQLL